MTDHELTEITAFLADIAKVVEKYLPDIEMQPDNKVRRLMAALKRYADDILDG